MHHQRQRTRIEDIRRIELIEAAHRVFIVHGLGGMTTARICAEAGMSAGILSYYFKGKEEVLFAMVRFNNRTLLDDVIARLRLADTGWRRFCAIVEGNFPERAYNQAVAAAWVSVCAASGTNPGYARLQRLFYRRLRSNLASVFRDAAGGARLEMVVLVVGALIDGLWLRKSAGEDVARSEAVALVIGAIEALLTEEERAMLSRPVPGGTAA